MERKNSKRVIVFLLTLCLLLAATGCKSEEQIQQQQVAEKAETPIYVDLRSTITVNGTGKATQTPDTATVYFSINNQGEESEAVQQENAQATQAVIDALLALGVAQADIETSAVDIYEQYDYDQEPPKVSGYQASCRLTVVFRNIDLVGEAITAAVAAGASEVQGPEFSLSDASAAYLEALSAAIADAQAKAEALAGGAQVTLVETPISIQETSTNRNVATLTMEAAVAEEKAEDEAAVAAPISVSDMEVTAQVTAVFEIR